MEGKFGKKLGSVDHLDCCRECGVDSRVQLGSEKSPEETSAEVSTIDV